MAKREREEATEAKVKKEIFKIKDLEPNVPKWLIKKDKVKTSPGVPTLFCSDWHWGEVVFPEQIGEVNKFNPRIAHERVQSLVSGALDLLFNHTVKPDYPGLVMPLGGDMFSGDIHEELAESNEQSTMESVMDLYGVLIWAIDTLKKKFDNIFLPCVTGNHGRNTRKPRHKNRVFTNFDWLLYQMLAKYYESDPNITFLVSDGSDLYYKIYNHVYYLTHGDQFRGGDGVIGHRGPTIRGDHKKRGRQSEIGQPYNTMLHGHFHTLSQDQRIIGNGSLKGYDEYAFNGNFTFEKPMQALWLTHPKHGITIWMPVHLEDSFSGNNNTEPNWISIPKK